MNWLEKGIALLAPGWALERSKHRHIMNAYEAANPSRLHKAKRSGGGADNAIFASGVSLREQARWLDENHDIVIGILDKLEERVIGARGIQIEPQPLTLDGKLHEEFATRLAKLWSEWSIRPEVTGMFTRAEMERLLLRSALRDGEVFSQLVRGPVPGLTHATRVQLSVEMLEADYVPMSLNCTGNTQICQGIEINTWGRPTAYNVYKYHPGNTLRRVTQTKRIPAENILHLAMRKRLHQLRGVSLLHGVITRLSDIKDYEESERVAARIAAALGFYIKRGEAASYQENEFEEPDSKYQMFDIGPGMIFDGLKPGEDLGMVESNRPNVHLYEFRNSQLRAVAAGTRGSYSSISRDYNGSYSSQRQELVEGFEGYNVLQNWFVGQHSRPIYRAWIDMLKLSGITIPDDVDPSSLYNALYLGPVMPWIDPMKEAQAWKGIVRGGAGTESEWIRARGQSPQEIRHQRLREIEYNRERGLVFDSDAANDKGGPSNEPYEPEERSPQPSSKPDHK
ncbi:phage portal protein [Rosenbergiella australiborealis]|uniref:phage portal protein n=1 Tax=Rosenbergiella australiborealis TaxID=1544696 RepID=UPI001F4E9009|nr:phage portal protein [Rosenbergiella australiborealis]